MANKSMPFLLLLLFLSPFSLMGQPKKTGGVTRVEKKTAPLVIQRSSSYVTVNKEALARGIADQRHLEILRGVLPVTRGLPDEVVTALWGTLSRTPSRLVRSYVQMAALRYWSDRDGKIPAYMMRKIQFVAGFGDPREAFGRGIEWQMHPDWRSHEFRPYDFWVFGKSRRGLDPYGLWGTGREGGGGKEGIVGEILKGSGLDWRDERKMCAAMEAMEAGSGDGTTRDASGRRIPVGTDSSSGSVIVGGGGDSGTAAGGGGSRGTVPWGSKGSVVGARGDVEGMMGMKGRGGPEAPRLFVSCGAGKSGKKGGEGCKEKEGGGGISAKGSEIASSMMEGKSLWDHLNSYLEAKVEKARAEAREANARANQAEAGAAAARRGSEPQPTVTPLTPEGLARAKDEEMMKANPERVNKLRGEGNSDVDIILALRAEQKIREEAARAERERKEREKREREAKAAKEKEEEPEEVEPVAVYHPENPEEDLEDCRIDDIDSCIVPLTEEQLRMERAALRGMGIDKTELERFLGEKYFADEEFRRSLYINPADSPQTTGGGGTNAGIDALRKGDNFDPDAPGVGGGTALFGVGDCGQFRSPKECQAAMPGEGNDEFCNRIRGGGGGSGSEGVGGGRGSGGIGPRPVEKPMIMNKGIMDKEGIMDLKKGGGQPLQRRR